MSIFHGRRPGRIGEISSSFERRRGWTIRDVLIASLLVGGCAFAFLGYTFRPRRAQNKRGELFASFAPAVSDEAAKAARRTIKRWRLHRWSNKTLADLARSINVIVRGWINYYGRFYPSELARSLRPINDYLVRWAIWKYKRLRRHPARAWQLLANVARRQPDLFAHWRLGLRPDGWTMGAR
jgi:RNA-directed DNA polymerase